MAILDQVIEMQRGGMTNSQIFANLQEQKFSPKEINDALSQAQIKSAMNEPQQEQQTSIMNTAPVAQAQPQEQQYQQGVYQDDYYTQTPQAYDQGYDSGVYNQGSVDTNVISEIAQQVVEEEFKDYRKKTGDMAAFKTSTEEKLSDLSSRLKRIEETIDKLQSSIIQKVGEFGENTNYIRKDLENLHNTTSKLMNPLIDNLNKTNNKPHSHKKYKSKK